MPVIHEAVQQLRIIDAHEHTSTFRSRSREQVGIFGLMHYLDSDLATAGMPRGALKDRSLSEEEKAELFLHYYRRTENTAYARMLKTAMQDLYGLEEWNERAVLELNEKVKAHSQDPEWYRTVLRQRSGIDMTIVLCQQTQVDFELFRPVMFMDFAYRARTREEAEQAVRRTGTAAATLRQYMHAVDELLQQFIREGMVAAKLGHAYWRSLACGAPTKEEAERSFERLLASRSDGPCPTQAELQPFQDYLIRFIICQCTAYGLPIQIHTGHHEPSVSGDGNNVTLSRAGHLIPLLLDYPEARFVLLHAGLPYHQEYLSIAKNFPNVYCDMTWVYLISPTLGASLLHQMIEMVPQSKVIGFGGDYNFVEGTYAHQKLARQVIADVLSERVARGWMTEAEALRFAGCMLRDNLLTLYRLDL